MQKKTAMTERTMCPQDETVLVTLENEWQQQCALQNCCKTSLFRMGCLNVRRRLPIPYLISAYTSQCNWKNAKFRKGPNSEIRCLHHQYQIRNTVIFGIIVDYQCAYKHTLFCLLYILQNKLQDVQDASIFFSTKASDGLMCSGSVQSG